MADLEIDIDTIVVKTAAQWAVDATVYINRQILITSDVFWGSTDQRKFKIADGTQTWAQLDYPPFNVAAYTLAQVLAAGALTNSIPITSNDGLKKLVLSDLFAYIENRLIDTYGSIFAGNNYATISGGDDNTTSSSLTVNKDFANLVSDLLIKLNAPNVELTQETASLILSTDASKRIKGLSTTTYPSLTELSYVKGITSSIQTQLDSKLSAIDYFNVNNLSVFDSTAYFIGQSTTAGTTVNQIPLVPVKAGVITKIVSEVFSASTIGSNEGGTLEFFYNDGANSTVISNDFKLDANRHAFVAFSGLNISVNSGNTYFVFTAPVLATNPTGIQFRFNVYMK